MTAAFRCTVADYSATSDKEKLGALTSAAGKSGFSTQRLQQISAWETTLAILGRCAERLVVLDPASSEWSFLLEYEIPRRTKRPDLVVLANDLIIVVEFKIGAISFTGADEWQVHSYALDLRDFHAASSGRPIVPVLVITGGRPLTPDLICDDKSARRVVTPVQRLAASDGNVLAATLLDIYRALHDESEPKIDPQSWDESAYRPSPNIIEAAETLFAGHSVSNISHSFATNLRSTTQELVNAIEYAQRNQNRTICFVTGIPGAGKTLAGLNVVHDPIIRRNDRPSAVFLSGNGPLVKIVRQALIRNRMEAGAGKAIASQAVSAFISNVHGFLDTYGIRSPLSAPHEHTIVFDEAQRAWNAAMVKKKRGIDKSEAELILEIMRRAPGWCVIVALVGGGQEIHTGEAGLSEWGSALNKSNESWRVIASNEVLRGGASVSGHRLFLDPAGPNLELIESPYLHLEVGVRCPRASWLGTWVNATLTSDPAARSFAADISQLEFPIGLTRELATARRWLDQHRDGEQRSGLLASSGALRLRPHGIEVSSAFRQGYQYIDWFLGARDDCRSSDWLEVAATEFECQGLELDWAGICWAGDLIYSENLGNLVARRFRGTKWMTIRDPTGLQYVLNKYRVLLTRARRGMVIWVPRGELTDPTRQPAELDATAEFLIKCGIPDLD